MPDNKEMAGKVLREKKEKHQKTTGVVTIIPGEPGKPAYRLGVKEVKVVGGLNIKREDKR